MPDKKRKTKKERKVRDLKPKKDAKGGSQRKEVVSKSIIPN